MESTIYKQERLGLQLLTMIVVAWHVGDVIRKLRELKQWKQEKLADAAELNKATIVRVEQGRDAKTPTIAKIALALGAPVGDLYAAVPVGTTTQTEGDATLQSYLAMASPERKALALEFLIHGKLGQSSVAAQPGAATGAASQATVVRKGAPRLKRPLQRAARSR